jgi:hypothetical protein
MNISEKPDEMDLPEQPRPASFPLRVSPDRRRLLDPEGVPFLMQGDAAWSLIANTSLSGTIRYLDERRALGFNTIMVSVMEYLFSADPPRDLAGNEPFLTPTDFTTPNPAYMDHVERVLELTAERGFLVLLAPAYLGYPDPHFPGYDGRSEGWYEEVLRNGVDGMRTWGDYLGRRFGTFDNVMWMLGGDRDPGRALEPLNALAQGLRSAGVTTPFTAHVHPEHSPVDVFPGADWLDVNPTYTYGIVHKSLIEDWNREPVWPFFLIESTYEGEHDASELQIRRQAYWSVLCGANGHLMGNNPMWLFRDGWEHALRSPGAVAMARWGDLFRGLPWADLEPDLDHRVATAGLGEARGLDRVTAAVTRDRRLAVAYLPVRRPLAIDIRAMAGSFVALEWFEPGTGLRANGGVLSGRSPSLVAPPFVEDSVLILSSKDGPDGRTS